MTGRAVRDRALATEVARTLAEDRFRDDLTTRVLAIGHRPIEARVTVQAAGTLSGIRPAREAARQARVRVLRSLRDGQRVRPGQEVLRLRGSARAVLGVERTVLNYLMHLSGVATATARVVAAVGSRARPPLILGTRKTIPGLRDLEKEAIRHGGGRPHRRDLAGAVLVKGNHLRLVPLERAVARLGTSGIPPDRIEVEVRTLAQAIFAARHGIRRLLIDNASPKRARSILRALERTGVRHRLTVELSGGITLGNASRYARCGADALSLGALTHSAPALPFHLEIEPSPSPPSP